MNKGCERGGKNDGGGCHMGPGRADGTAAEAVEKRGQAERCVGNRMNR